MNFAELTNHFWLKNEYDPCSPSEIALYHYLLFEANRQQWVMPFKVVTKMLEARLGMSRQAVSEARHELQKKGLITFSKGEGKGRPALYTLAEYQVSGGFECCQQLSSTAQVVLKDTTHDLTDALTEKDVQEQTQKITQEATQQSAIELTQDLSQETTNELTQINSHEQTQEQMNDVTNQQVQETALGLSQSCDNSLTEAGAQRASQSMSQTLPLAKLRSMLINDVAWHAKLRQLLEDDSIFLDESSLAKAIGEFFNWQESKGITERDENDCRKHVFNSIRKRYGTTNR